MDSIDTPNPVEATKQARNMNFNPTGKGGFGDHPELRSNGGWKRENTLSYQYRRFLSMTMAEFKAYAKTPAKNQTMAEHGAYSRVKQLRNSLPDAKEIADRTEGKAIQQVNLSAEIHTIDNDLD